MNFENWLNEAKKEIEKRKEKDKKESPRGLAPNYDERIHKLYGMYQEDKNSRAIIFLTLILGLTAIATFFKETDLIEILPLILIYAIFILIIILIFKKSKKRINI